MRIVASLLLLLFVVFLTTPTIVGCIEKNNKVSASIDLEEDDTNETKDFKNFKELASSEFANIVLHFPAFFLFSTKKRISIPNKINSSTISFEILLPPPDLV